MPGSVVLIDKEGNPHELPEEQVADAISIGGWRVQTDADVRARANTAAREATYGGVRGTVGAVGAGGLDAVTLGGFSAGVRAAGGREDLAALKEENAGAYLAGNIAGSVATSVVAPGSILSKLPGGAAVRAGQLAGAGEGATTAARIGLAARGQAVEGAIQGFGQGVAELATAEDPITLGRAASVLSSNALYGGGTGALGGAGTKAIAEGLGAARTALSAAASRGSAEASAAAAIPEDLSKLDAKELRKLRDAERTALEEGRVSQRTALKGELDVERKTLDEQLVAQRAALRGEIEAEKALAETDLVSRRTTLRADHDAELAAIEEARVAGRAEVADELGAFRRGTKDEKIFLTTKGADDPEIRALGKRTLKADRQLDQLLDNPKNLAQRPERAIAALQQQESAFEEILARRESLLQRFANDTSGERAAALDATERALQRNRELQTRIGELSGKPSSAKLQTIRDEIDSLPTRASSARVSDLRSQLDALPSRPTSQRLTEIQGSLDGLSSPTKSARLADIERAIDSIPEAGKRGIGEQMLSGGAYSAAAAAVSAIPFVGPLLAPIVGARAAEAASNLVFGKIGGAVSAASTRAAAAAEKFVGLAEKIAAAPASTAVASRVLQELTYAPATAPIEGQAEKRERREKSKAAQEDGRKQLAKVFRQRSDEILSQVEVDETGSYQMRPAARAAMAERLLPIRTVAPVLADRMETHAARRIAYLAQKLPKRPDTGAMRTGPDRWAPSEMEIRSFARSAAAVEDPHGVFERLARGKITPEEAEAVHAVHIELAGDMTDKIMAGLQKSKKRLSYKKRLAFSIFTGAPVDPSMNPAVFAILQGSFANEPGTEGGTQAPTPQPQFGSVKAEEPTRAQERK